MALRFKADQRAYKSSGTPQHGNLLHTLGKGSTGSMLRVKTVGVQSVERQLGGGLNLIGLKSHKYPQEILTIIILALKRAGKSNSFKANNEVHWGTRAKATSHIGSQSYIHKGDPKPLQSSRNPGPGKRLHFITEEINDGQLPNPQKFSSPFQALAVDLNVLKCNTPIFHTSRDTHTLIICMNGLIKLQLRS